MKLTEQAIQEAATALDVDVATIKAVAEVESKNSGFLPSGEPVILFERHVFSRLTNGRYDAQYPDISNKLPGSYGKVTEQHPRLQKAASLDREAALESASWGRFQIMGFNYKQAGFNTLQGFINAMYKSEDEHLKAFISFIKNNGLQTYLQVKNWAEFARRYNGSDYKKNNYDTKLAQAYRKYAA